MQTVLDGLEVVPTGEDVPEVSLRELLRVLFRRGVYLSRIRYDLPPSNEVAWWVRGGRTWYGTVTRLNDQFRSEFRWQFAVYPLRGNRTWQESVHVNRDVTPVLVLEALRKIGVDVSDVVLARYTQDGEGK